MDSQQSTSSYSTTTTTTTHHNLQDEKAAATVAKNRYYHQNLFTPFPARSITLLTGPSSVGKSYYLSRILEHPSLYFAEPPNRIYVVLCNNRVPPYSLNRKQEEEEEEEDEEEEPAPPPPLIQVPLAEFNTEDLEAGDCLIIEDLQAITPEVRQAINVVTHHYNLNSCFVVTHSLLGNNNFELLSLCHRVIFFLRSSAVSRTAKYVVRNFFQDTETRNYLLQLIGFCERLGEPLLIETSPLASSGDSLHHIALSHLPHLVTRGYSLVYPHPRMNILYHKNQSDPSDLKTDYLNSSREGDQQQQQQQETVGGKEEDNTQELQYPPNTFIVFSSQALDIERKRRRLEAAKQKEQQQWEEREETAAKGKNCAATTEKEEWERLTREIEERIEAYFPSQKHTRVKNLAREILSHPNFCISLDARLVHLKQHQKTTRVPLLDFLAVATRPLGPSENVSRPDYQAFRKMAQSLLARGTPTHLIKNRFLLSSSATTTRSAAATTSKKKRHHNSSSSRRGERAAKTGRGNGNNNNGNKSNKKTSSYYQQGHLQPPLMAPLPYPAPWMPHYY